MWFLLKFVFSIYYYWYHKLMPKTFQLSYKTQSYYSYSDGLFIIIIIYFWHCINHVESIHIKVKLISVFCIILYKLFMLLDIFPFAYIIYLSTMSIFLLPQNYPKSRPFFQHRSKSQENKEKRNPGFPFNIDFHHN